MDRLGPDDRVHHATARHGPDVAQVPKRAGEGKERGQRHEGAQDRDDDHPEFPPPAAHLEDGVVEELLGDPVERGEQEDRGERPPAPDVEQDQADEPPGPVSHAGVEEQTEADHHGPVRGVQRRGHVPVPGDDPHPGGVGPGEERGEVHQRPARERPVEDERHGNAHGQLEHAGDDDVSGRVGGAEPEPWIVQDLEVVAEADERRTGPRHRREVGQAEPDLPRQRERLQPQDQREEDHGEDQHRVDHLLFRDQVHEHRRHQASLDGGDDQRHRDRQRPVQLEITDAHGDGGEAEQRHEDRIVRPHVLADVVLEVHASPQRR